MPAAQASYGQGPAASPATATPRGVMVPFDQASHRGLEPGPTYSFTPGSSQQVFGPDPLPAQGYLRSVIIEVTGASGAGTGAGKGDYPWNILNLIRLQDTNGAPLFELSGYNTLLSNIYGGYAGSPDPRNDPDYSADGNNAKFQIRIPVEFAPNGLGALANQSASASYRLTIIGETSANIWATAPTTIPTFSIKVYMDYWTLPAALDMLGRQQEVTPPFHGTAQYWTQSMNNSVASGFNETRITRTGNLIRTLIFVARESGVRNDGAFPDPFILNWDSRNLMDASAKTLRKIMREMVESLSARDTGVYTLSYSYGQHRHVGDNAVNSLLPTVSATRLTLNGQSSAAGTIDVIVNDVSVAETNPAARGVQSSATGYHPPVGREILGAM